MRSLEPRQPAVSLKKQQRRLIEIGRGFNRSMNARPPPLNRAQVRDIRKNLNEEIQMVLEEE